RLAQSLVAAPARVIALDLGAGVLDEPVVAYPGRAGRHTGHAAEAGVEVPDHRRAQRLALDALLHQVDAPARRVHFLAPQHVRGAGGQAESTVDAVVDQLEPGRVVVIERAHQMPPTNRPGANRPSGSNCSFTRRMSVSPSTGPHTSRRSRIDSGAVSTTQCPPPARASARRSLTRLAMRPGSVSPGIPV